MRKTIYIILIIVFTLVVVFAAFFLKKNFLSGSALTCSTRSWKNCFINLDKAGDIGLANPASANCQDKGGELIMKKDEKGNEYGICRLTNGGECEEWAYLRGDCSSGDSITYKKNSQIMAEDWIRYNAPSYIFDGFNLQFVSSETLQCSYCFKFKFKFTSKNSGYGDRSGLKLDKTITFHTVEIVVEKGVIKSVITDGKFDEMVKDEIE